jgi:hypothetical protein
VQRSFVVIDGHPDRQAAASVTGQQIEQGRLHLVHWLHGVGQHIGLEATRQHLVEHRRQLGVHEGFAAGEADQLRGVAVALNLF